MRSYCLDEQSKNRTVHNHDLQWLRLGETSRCIVDFARVHVKYQKLVALHVTHGKEGRRQEADKNRNTTTTNLDYYL